MTQPERWPIGGQTFPVGPVLVQVGTGPQLPLKVGQLRVEVGQLRVLVSPIYDLRSVHPARWPGVAMGWEITGIDWDRREVMLWQLAGVADEVGRVIFALPHTTHTSGWAYPAGTGFAGVGTIYPEALHPAEDTASIRILGRTLPDRLVPKRAWQPPDWPRQYLSGYVRPTEVFLSHDD